MRQKTKLPGGKTYQFRVALRAEGMEDLNIHLVHGLFDNKGKFNDGVFEYERHGGLIVGTNRFPGPADPADVEVRLYFRFSLKGQVWWHSVSLEEVPALPARPVTIVCKEGALPKGAGLEYWDRWLDKAGQAKPDIVLLPEMFNGKKPALPEPLDGPSGTLLSRKARQWNMFTCASFYEKRGDLVYNTAPLYDRKGKLVGTYEKNYPYDPELDDGVTPGSRFPVFETEFGRVGIMICYDSWFPESARALALKGAELLLFPNAGYCEGLMPARAADNGMWVAVSSLNCTAGVWDSGGARAGDVAPQSYRGCDSSILAAGMDREDGMLIATVDLSRKFSPGWHGGPMRSAPGTRRVRRTRMEPIEPFLAKETNRWWKA